MRLIVFGMCGVSLILEQPTSVDCRNYVFVIYDLNKSAQMMHESKGDCREYGHPLENSNNQTGTPKLQHTISRPWNPLENKSTP